MWSTELPNSVLVDGHIVQPALAEGAGGAEEEEDDDHEGGDDESAAGDSCGADGKPPAAKGKGRGRGAKHAATPKAMKTMKAKSPKKEEAASPKKTAKAKKTEAASPKKKAAKEKAVPKPKGKRPAAAVEDVAKKKSKAAEFKEAVAEAEIGACTDEDVKGAVTRDDLELIEANLPADAARPSDVPPNKPTYKVKIEGHHGIQVQLLRSTFYVLKCDAIPEDKGKPIARNEINKKGGLTVAWAGDVHEAWSIAKRCALTAEEIG